MSVIDKLWQLHKMLIFTQYYASKYFFKLWSQKFQRIHFVLQNSQSFCYAVETLFYFLKIRGKKGRIEGFLSQNGAFRMKLPNKWLGFNLRRLGRHNQGTIPYLVYAVKIAAFLHFETYLNPIFLSKLKKAHTFQTVCSFIKQANLELQKSCTKFSLNKKCPNFLGVPSSIRETPILIWKMSTLITKA